MRLFPVHCYAYIVYITVHSCYEILTWRTLAAATGPRPGGRNPGCSATIVEKEGGKGPDHAGRSPSGRDEYAFGLPALPGPRGYFAGAAAAHQAGDSC